MAGRRDVRTVGLLSIFYSRGGWVIFSHVLVVLKLSSFVLLRWRIPFCSATSGLS